MVYRGSTPPPPLNYTHMANEERKRYICNGRRFDTLEEVVEYCAKNGWMIVKVINTKYPVKVVDVKSVK